MKSTMTLGERTIGRLGFGAMRITGEGIWGWPDDREGARRLLKRVVELGVTLIDTADAYGPETSEYLIAEALSPYPDGLLVATKGGLVRGGPGDWQSDARPEHLRRALENSLRRLGVERIGLYQLHAPDPTVPFADSVGELSALRDEGKIELLGLSNVSVDQIEEARSITPIATVQNRYNLTDRDSRDVLEHCAEHGIGFIPWYPLATGRLAEQDEGALCRIARERDLVPSQIALAWLLQRAPVVLPIPGTSSIEHLEQNVAARELTLTEDEMSALNALA